MEPYKCDIACCEVLQSGSGWSAWFHTRRHVAESCLASLAYAGIHGKNLVQKASRRYRVSIPHWHEISEKSRPNVNKREIRGGYVR